jgi:glutamyl-tRNA reductase
MPAFSVIGVSHRTAAVAVREPLALSADQAGAMLAAIRTEATFAEALVLSTCNRTELYFVPRAGGDPVAAFLGHIARAKGAAPTTDASVLYRHDDLAAARHLYRVAASLDSQIVGEHQVLAQVKDAYRLATTHRTTGIVLNKLLHGAMHVGKRVRTETDLGRGSAGVSQAAVELARHLFTRLEDKTVLLVGAGQTAEIAARTLLACGAARLIVANRTIERARQLAQDLARPPAAEACEEPIVCPVEPGGVDRADPIRCPALLARAGSAADAGGAAHLAPHEYMGGEHADAQAPDDSSSSSPPLAPREEGRQGPDAAASTPPAVATEAIGLDALPAAIRRADLVISSTASDVPVLTLDALGPALQGRRGPLLVIDIAVPRDVDEKLGRLENVFLYNMDDLDRLVERNLARRRAEIPRAEAIIDVEVAEFAAWAASLEVAPTIALLQQYLATIQQALIDQYGKKFADREELERFTQVLCNRILHNPVAQLKALAGDGDPGERLATVAMIRRLFDLDSMDRK